MGPQGHSRACALGGGRVLRGPRRKWETGSRKPEAGRRPGAGARGERERERPPPPEPPASPPAPRTPSGSPPPPCGPARPEVPPAPRSKGPVYRLGSTRCRRCLITFADAAFAARHAKREHPRDFAAAALRGALFVCFVCARPFASSPALLRHQRGHAPRARPPAGPAPRPRRPGAGRGDGGGSAPPRPRPAGPAPAPGPAYACTECGRAFAREGALHRHYIRHARGEL
ncbi:zinc finger protein 576-like [Struthio camelus]|uniref:zinc finger protein 576-like n=1 Tax=Struthio camelus TaxID=8801 RepID=UPI003603AD71